MKLSIGIVKVSKGKLVGTEVKVIKTCIPKSLISMLPLVGFIFEYHKEKHWIVCQGDKAEVGKLTFELKAILESIQHLMNLHDLSLTDALERYLDNLEGN
jgi:hypothetical protein